MKPLCKLTLLPLLAWLFVSLMPAAALSQSMKEVLGAGDTVRITAFRYPELTTEARLSQEGKISVPMIGQVTLAGMTPDQAARHIAERLKSGNYILNPHIEVSVLEARSRQVSVLGFVTHPGRYVLDGTSQKLTDVLAMAGGLAPDASDVAVVTRTQGGKKETFDVNVADIIRAGDAAKDMDVRAGDSVFVAKAPVVYVYGEVMRGGSYRLEPGMTVMQAISVAGGISPRGSDSRVKLRHRTPDGHWSERSADPVDLVAADDVVFVRESLF